MLKRVKLMPAILAAITLLSTSGLAQAGTAPTGAAALPVITAPVTALPPVTKSDPRFGVVQAFEAPQLAQNAGARWERVPFFWNKAQPNDPSQWYPDQFEMSSAQLAGELSSGMEVVGQIGNPPAWATKDGSTPANLNLPWDAPTNYWGQFVYKLAQTYAGKIDSWIIWNEPDFPRGDPLSTWAGTEQDYYLLLKDASQAIKAANPNAKIIFAGTTYWVDVNAGRTLFFQRVLEAGRQLDGPAAAAAGYYFDAVDLHLYGSPLDLYRVPQAYKQIMTNFGISKPIWISEMNIPPYNDPGNEVPAGFLRSTLDEQANFVIRGFAMALAAGVQRISVYKMIDGAVPDKTPWGMVRNDGSLRPEYVGYQVAASHFANPGTVTYWNGGGVDFVSFDRGDNRTWMLVNTAPTPTTASVPWLGTSATITTKLGASTNESFPGLTNGQPPQLSVTLPGATNGVIGGDPIIVDETNIGGFVDVSPEQIFFPVAGHSVANAVLDYWRANGGIKHFGPPTSDEAKKPDRVVQTFANSTIQVFPAFAGTDLYVQEGTGKVYPTNPAKPSNIAGSQYFKETGHNVAYAFLQTYKSLGGMDVFGFPRTEAMEYQGQTIQFFQRAVMVYHPELAGTPGQVELRLLGTDLTKGRTFPTSRPPASASASASPSAIASASPTPSAAGSSKKVAASPSTLQFFPETSHIVADAFLKYFKSHGGTAVLGYPISDALVEATPDGVVRTVQYFQRARMEYHPELAGKSGEVSLGLLGDELLRQMGWLPRAS